ncbi:MAG TPA: AraC family transcriptional regulator [Polyangiales bacterium]|jgi:AraC-like DNA-binding protein|nr:AraC family transcriptional regulator [Polyangiales bacterium]
MSVSISLVRALVEAVDRGGVSPERFLEQASFPRVLLDDASARIEVSTYDALQELALDLTGDPALGLHMGDQPSVSAFQIVGLLASHCRTVREGLEVFFRYHRIVADCPQSYLTPHGDDVLLVYNYLRTTPRCSRLRAEFGITRLLRIGDMFRGPRDVPMEIWFEHAEPDYAAEYARVFQPRRVRFSQPHTGMVMPRSYLELEQLHPNESVFQLLKAEADKQLQEIEGPAPLSGKIHHLVVHRFTDTEPDMDMIARRLGMSSRSLRRRLQEEGTSFNEVVSLAMGELACNVLREPNTTIQEAAYRLGFAEASSFHRAFKRWTGKTPKQFRDATGG